MPIDFDSCHVYCEHNPHKRKCCSVGAFHQLQSGEDLKTFANNPQRKVTKLALKNPETPLQIALKLFLFSAVLITD